MNMSLMDGCIIVLGPHDIRQTSEKVGPRGRGYMSRKSQRSGGSKKVLSYLGLFSAVNREKNREKFSS